MGVSCLKWIYGVTSCESRMSDLLPQTLASLRNAGFDRPLVFVDGVRDPMQVIRELDKRGMASTNVSVRYPAVRTVANWMLTAMELYLREPEADRYAVFQDDLVACKNLQLFLERTPYPADGYLNLYTFPNQNKPDNNGVGWCDGLKLYSSGAREYHGKPQQKGLGAVALVFNRKAFMTLLAHQHMIDRQQSPDSRYKRVDGGIVETMNKAGYREYVHTPSLVQHTGVMSSMGNRPHRQADTFRGESFDALQLLT